MGNNGSQSYTDEIDALEDSDKEIPVPEGDNNATVAEEFLTDEDDNDRELSMDAQCKHQIKPDVDDNANDGDGVSEGDGNVGGNTDEANKNRVQNNNLEKKNVQVENEQDESLHNEDKSENDKIERSSSRKISAVAIKEKILQSNPVRSIRRKTSNIVAPHNLDIVEYCKTLINVSFHGQLNTDITNKTSLLSLINDNTSECSLPMFLQSMDELLRSFGKDYILTGEEEEFKYYIQGLMEHRNSRESMEKFWKDTEIFVELYNKRDGLSDELKHTEYWGSRQQLLAGKIIADYVHRDYGGIDPIFGILLCPVAGRAGPGDSGLVHEILFDEDGPLAYHSAVHDAFGYLLTFHNVGPGYNYIGADCEILNASRCMSGQISGLYFWRELLKSKSERRYVVV